MGRRRRDRRADCALLGAHPHAAARREHRRRREPLRARPPALCDRPDAEPVRARARTRRRRAVRGRPGDPGRHRARVLGPARARGADLRDGSSWWRRGGATWGWRAGRRWWRDRRGLRPVDGARDVAAELEPGVRRDGAVDLGDVAGDRRAEPRPRHPGARCAAAARHHPCRERRGRRGVAAGDPVLRAARPPPGAGVGVAIRGLPARVWREHALLVVLGSRACSRC